MFTDYADIRDRLGTPLWFDESGVPRYCEFHPRRIANIHAREAALLSISCVICGQEYIVAKSTRAPKPTICEMIQARMLQYGEPPNTNCCGNAHMNSEPRKVLQYWRRRPMQRWERDATFETDIRPEWVIDQDLDHPWKSEFVPNSAGERLQSVEKLIRGRLLRGRILER